MNWSELSPRERDALVAEKVMGYETGSVGNNLKINSAGGCGTYECQKLHWKDMPHYTTDISAAWEVVEKLGGYWQLTRFTQGPRQYSALMNNSVSVADTMPEAICLAALKAVGVEV